MQQKPAPKFTLATNAQLKNPPYCARLKLAVANMEISDREWPTEIQDMLLQVDMQNGQIWTAPEQVAIPLIDDVWGDERFVRRFLASETCEHPDKVRWLDLYFRVKHPRVARHFGR